MAEASERSLVTDTLTKLLWILYEGAGFENRHLQGESPNVFELTRTAPHTYEVSFRLVPQLHVPFSDHDNLPAPYEAGIHLSKSKLSDNLIPSNEPFGCRFEHSLRTGFMSCFIPDPTKQASGSFRSEATLYFVGTEERPPQDLKVTQFIHLAIRRTAKRGKEIKVLLPNGPDPFVVLKELDDLQEAIYGFCARPVPARRPDVGLRWWAWFDHLQGGMLADFDGIEISGATLAAFVAQHDSRRAMPTISHSPTNGLRFMNCSGAVTSGSTLELVRRKTTDPVLPFASLRRAPGEVLLELTGVEPEARIMSDGHIWWLRSSGYPGRILMHMGFLRRGMESDPQAWPDKPPTSRFHAGARHHLASRSS